MDWPYPCRVYGTIDHTLMSRPVSLSLPVGYSMRSRVNVTVGCPSVRLSVCLSRRSTAAAACGGFAEGRRYPGAAINQSIYLLPVPALSSKCARAASCCEPRNDAQRTVLLDWMSLSAVQMARTCRATLTWAAASCSPPTCTSPAPSWRRPSTTRLVLSWPAAVPGDRVPAAAPSATTARPASTTERRRATAARYSCS